MTSKWEFSGLIIRLINLHLFFLVSFVSPLIGQDWVKVGNGLKSSSEGIDDMIVFNNYLYVGGYFQVEGTDSIENIARWDGQIWEKVGDGISDWVTGLESFNGKLYASTNFGDVYELNGSNWTKLGNGVQGTIWDIKGSNGILYACHNFNTVSGYWGNTWIPFGGHLKINKPLVLGEINGQLVVAGETCANDSFLVFRFEQGRWVSLGNNIINSCPHVATLIEFNGELYAGGSFSNPFPGFIKWDDVTKSWTEVVPSTPVSAVSSTIFDGDLHVGSNKVRRLINGQWVQLEGAFNGVIHSMIEYKGELYVGGTFSQIAPIRSLFYTIAKWQGTISNVEPQEQINHLLFSPNPIGEVLFISQINSFVQNQENYLTIYTLAGKVVFQKQFDRDSEIRFDRTKILPGVYILKFGIKNPKFTKAIFK